MAQLGRYVTDFLGINHGKRQIKKSPAGCRQALEEIVEKALLGFCF
jgi:hypothetical protein